MKHLILLALIICSLAGCTVCDFYPGGNSHCSVSRQEKQDNWCSSKCANKGGIQKSYAEPEQVCVCGNGESFQ